MKKKVFLLLSVIITLSITRQFANAQCEELIWSDEFDVDGAVNSENWTYEIWTPGRVNNELQYYTDRPVNSRVEDGILIIQAIREDYLGADWTSARIQARNKVDFLYGTLEARLQLPGGRGMWAAFWMMPTVNTYGGWPSSGEYDIMEYVGYDENRVHSTIHTAAFNHTIGTQIGESTVNPTVETEFHTYKVVWTPDSMVTYLDDVKFFKYDNPGDDDFAKWPFKHEFYPIINLAVGGDWGGAQGIDPELDTGTYLIDYVRLYKSKATLAILGEKEVYANDSALQYSIFYQDGWTYEWIAPEGTEIIGDIDTSWIEINWGCDDDTLLCKVVGGCIDDTIAFFIKVVLPSIEGPMFFDVDETGLTFSIPEKTDTEYLWIVPDDAAITSGQGTNAITVDWGATADSVMVVITNECGTDTIAKNMWLRMNYPYPDMVTPHSIPGRIYAADYDIGGEGVAYHDADAENVGPGIRQDEGVDTETNDGSYRNVGWIDSGEWLEYTVQVEDEEEGLHGLRIRFASNNSGARGPMTVLINGEERATYEVPFTGDWGSFRSVTENIMIYENDTLIRLDMGVGGFNVSYMDFVTPVSVNEELAENLNVYPNPFNDNLIIESDNPVNLIQLIDMSGKIILKNNCTNTKYIDLNTGDIQKGLYILVVGFNNGARTYKKIIK
ncbi:MAG: family 16 glycosylhydrolase [Bacteroidales bacterium]|nr:family 16 glycosylhydrolase [Bacteroidales bacterium]